MTSPSTDVIVIGAGPVGLTLACELLRHGARVRLVDKKAEPNQHPNAAIVHVRTLEILSAMGAVDGFLKEGFAFPGFHSFFFGKHVAYLDITGLASPYPQPRTIPQQKTEQLLRDHLARLGGGVERPVEAVGIEQDEDEVRVRLKHLGEGDREEVATAQFVVGCEGASSITREASKIDFPGERYPGKEFLQADAHVRWSYPQGFGYQFMGNENVVLLFAYDDQGHNRIICARDDKNPDNHEPPTLEEMQDILRAQVDPGAELYDPVWLNRFRSGHRLAARFREGRAFLAGDAGHVHIPIGGQGMNYGMHDAFNLGWKLAAVAKGEAKKEVLESYETERHAADAALIKGTDLGFHLMVKPNPVSKMAMQLLAPAMLHLDAVQEHIRNLLGEMNVAYPTSTLSEDHHGSTGPAAGDRAPDALLVKLPEQETRTLFDLLRGTHWTLLLFAGTEPTADDLAALQQLSNPLFTRYGKRIAPYLVLCTDPPAPVQENGPVSVIMDRPRYVHLAYGVTNEPCVYLIRPDWHVGFRGGLDASKVLGAYLERVLS